MVELKVGQEVEVATGLHGVSYTAYITDLEPFKDSDLRFSSELHDIIAVLDDEGDLNLVKRDKVKPLEVISDRESEWAVKLIKDDSSEIFGGVTRLYSYTDNRDGTVTYTDDYGDPVTESKKHADIVDPSEVGKIIEDLSKELDDLKIQMVQLTNVLSNDLKQIHSNLVS